MVPPALRTWESLEFVELIMLLSSQRRQQILSLMKLWLTEDVYGLNHPGIRGDLDLEEIRMEIVEQWDANRKPV
jgi:hypothetical protein